MRGILRLADTVTQIGPGMARAARRIEPRTLAAGKGVCATARDRGKAPAPRVKSERGPPMTLGDAAAAGVRLIVWCWIAATRSSPDPV
jgi:hypothetical protein